MSSYTNFDATLKIEYTGKTSEVKFLSQPLWKVLGGFDYYTEVLPQADKLWVRVPDGYLSDGATIPRILWSWLPPFGEYGQAAVLHDYIRKTLTMYLDSPVEDQNKQIFITIAQSDRVFLEAMKVLGVSKPKRLFMYIFVRGYAILKTSIKYVQSLWDKLSLLG